MNPRLASAVGALSILLSACPPAAVLPDGGTPDGGALQGACTGGCASHEVCDEATHTCRDGCGGCATGQCVREGPDTFRCVASPVVTCGGQQCAPGQTACRDGACSCLPSSMALADTCAPLGRVCHEVFNPVTRAGGTCEKPGYLEPCVSSQSAAEACQAGLTCAGGLLASGLGLCAPACGAGGTCSVDEVCDSDTNTCLPGALFMRDACIRGLPLEDGGTLFVDVPVPGACHPGARPDAGPDGTCHTVRLMLPDAVIDVRECRTPGPLPLNARCTPLARDESGRCEQGLECVPTGVAGEGVCLQACNGVTDAPTGGCPAGQRCANLSRRPDREIAMGVCLAACDVFGRDAGTTCAPLAGEGGVLTATACVPTPAGGGTLVSATGEGLCVLALPGSQGVDGGEGAPCAETDPFRGAACQTGLVCARPHADAAPVCARPCDVECSGAQPPARCAELVATACQSPRTCTAISAPFVSVVGYCLAN